VKNRKMKKLAAILIILNITILNAQLMDKNIYSYKVTTLEGKEFDLASLKGKKVMIVNTASKCGYTPQYADLEKLYEKYRNDNFVIIGFPANNFGAQEPGSNSEIAEFCKKNYGVTFPMMEKISVKGDDMHPLYKFLTQKELNGKEDSKVKWNFQKYLINEDGTLHTTLGSEVEPMDEKIITWITKK
jgi:glutathione peroxidase